MPLPLSLARARRPPDPTAAAGSLLATLLLSALPALADFVEERPLNLYGMPGMIDMPSARFMPDGGFAVTGAGKRPDDRITIAFQALPWLETTARYSVVYGYFPNDANHDLFDRSIGLKIRLTREETWLPEIAIGALDVGGTQVFAGEYLVASKKFGPVDATLGLGFGRLGSRGHLTNPLVVIGDRFKTRPPAQTTGTFEAKKLFRGEDAAPFAGIVVDTPVKGLQFLGEYSGDSYTAEVAQGLAKDLSPFNFGVSYRPVRFLELGAAFVQNHVVAARISMRTNFKNPPPVYKLDPPAPRIRVRTPQEREADPRRDDAARLVRDPFSGNVASHSGVLAGDIANPPDWTIYPVAAASMAPDATSPSGEVSARLEAALAPTGLVIVEQSVDGASLVVQLARAGARSGLDCQQLWDRIAAISLGAFDLVRFELPAPDGTLLRCVKFLRRTPTDPNPRSLPQVPVAARDRAWWADKSYTRPIADKVATILAAQRLQMEAIKFTPTEAIVHVRNPTYPSVAKAAGRAARAMTQVLPAPIDIITIVLTTGSLNGTKLSISRSALERAASSTATPEEIFTATTMEAAPPGLPSGSFKPKGQFPAIRPVFAPAYRHSLFDPDDPLRFQLFWRGGLEFDVFRGLTISAVYDANIYNNFDTIKRDAASQLPHVRSDIAKYLKEGASGIETLDITWMHQLAPGIYGRLSAGYLEDMYGGVDAELLYRPFASRWAFGLEAAQVYKRDFDRRFGFQDYEIATGHASVYFESPWYGLNFNVHAGRYLAGDWGATFELARRFDNGAEIGAFATFTDVPFDVYGEGSFDKGISIRFPFDLFSLFSTRQEARMTFRPLTRDGGARLGIDHRLYEETRPVSYGETMRNWGDFLARR